MAEATTLTTITSEMQRLLRDGARPSKLASYPRLLGLRAVTDRAAGAHLEAVFALEQLIVEAVERCGDGAEGQALRLLYGLCPDTRARPLKDRRRLAADHFDVMPSTFRRYYEDELVGDLAMEMWRAECAAEQQSKLVA